MAIFLNSSAQATSSRPLLIIMHLRQLGAKCLQRFLQWTRSSARAFVGISSLYVASERQFFSLLEKQKATSVLDIGSGTGSETEKIASVLSVERNNVVCIDTSKHLQKVLRSRGFSVHDSIPDTKFSFASLLNVLDRTEDPHSLLESTIDAMAPGGTLLVATVLPFSGLVEGKSGSKSRPKKKLKIGYSQSPSFEISALLFVEALFREHPSLELVNWARAPYLSSGNTKKTHFVLDMALISFRVQKSARVKKTKPVKPRTKLHPLVCKNKKTDTIFAFLTSTLKAEGITASVSWGDVLDLGLAPPPCAIYYDRSLTVSLRCQRMRRAHTARMNYAMQSKIWTRS